MKLIAFALIGLAALGLVLLWIAAPLLEQDADDVVDRGESGEFPW